MADLLVPLSMPIKATLSSLSSRTALLLKMSLSTGMESDRYFEFHLVGLVWFGLVIFFFVVMCLDFVL